jgi:mRNA interferase RelE/StbE
VGQRTLGYGPEVTVRLFYHPQVQNDVASLPANLRRRLRSAVESRLTSEPRRYGRPLRASLHGCWKLRVGDYRVVFRIDEAEVWILAVLHRKRAYEMLASRADWAP